MSCNLDLLGNRNTVTDTTAATQSYMPNIINQIVANMGTPAIGYGSEHEIANDQSVAYSYINDARLTHVTSDASLRHQVRRTRPIGHPHPQWCDDVLLLRRGIE